MIGREMNKSEQANIRTHALDSDHRDVGTHPALGWELMMYILRFSANTVCLDANICMQKTVRDSGSVAKDHRRETNGHAIEI